LSPIANILLWSAAKGLVGAHTKRFLCVSHDCANTFNRLMVFKSGQYGFDFESMGSCALKPMEYKLCNWPWKFACFL